MAKIKRMESEEKLEFGPNETCPSPVIPDPDLEKTIEKYNKHFRASPRYAREIQKIYAQGKLKEKYNTFKLFSLDASDLTVLDNMEKPLDLPKRKKIMREMRRAKSFLDRLETVLQKAQEEKDTAIIDACTKGLKKIMKVKDEIVREKWYKTRTSPISYLSVNED